MSLASRIISEELIEDVTNKSLFCICCMGQSGTFIRLASCAHKEYLESFPISDLNPGIPKVVCSKCHNILKTVTRFKEQVWNSLDILLEKVNHLEKIESTKSNLEISETLHCNIDQVDNPEHVSDNSRKFKNISTALGIINSNAASMSALTSSQNFIGLTETLLQATTLGFNLPLVRETVLSKLRTNNLADNSTATSTVKLREDNSADVLPVDINQDLHKSNNIPEKNKMETVNKTKNETILEMVHENINRVRDNNGTNTVEFINVNESQILRVDKDKYRETGNANTMSQVDNNELSDRHNITSENIEMEIEVIKNEPDLDIVQEKFRKPVKNREAVIAIHFEDKTRPINIKTESEPRDPLSTNNENRFPEIFVKPEINEEIGDVGIVGTYGTAVLPDTIKFEPEDQEEVEDCYMDSDTATEADKNSHKDVKVSQEEELVPRVNGVRDGEFILGNRSLTELGYEELMKQHGENLHSTESYRWKYPCEHCIIGFQYKENLIDHVKRKHPTETNQPNRYLICDICQDVVPVTDFEEHHLRHHNGFYTITEKYTDDSQDERNKNRKVDDTADGENEKREKRLQEDREQSQRYRKKKRNALVFDNLAETEEKREERLRYNREKSKRYRERKKNEANKQYSKRYRDKHRTSNLLTPNISNQKNVSLSSHMTGQSAKDVHFVPAVALSTDAAHSSNKILSDPSVLKMKKEKNKQYSKRYRDKLRTSNLLTPNISNQKNVSLSSHMTGQSAKDVHFVPPLIGTSQIAGPSTKDMPYVVPIVYSSQVEGISSRVPNSPSIHTNNNSSVKTFLLSHLSFQILKQDPPNIDVQTYSAFHENSSAHRQFEKELFENEFGHACDICDRLWFKNDLKYLHNNDATQNIKFIKTLLLNIALKEIKVCSTCFKAIQKQRIPPLAVYNGFKYPPLPDCLRDSPLDLVTERFISPRIPFMQIRTLRHVPGQYGIYGQVINIPIEVNTMVNLLPRQADDDHAISVHIKRKKIHKSSDVCGIARKSKVKVWLRYLKDTPLYKSYDVSVDDGFLNGTNDAEDEIIFDDDGDNDILEQIAIEESLMAQQQTLMWNDDTYLRIVPGEGNVPKSLLFDEHAEELSFPQIYLGQFREFRNGLPVTPFMMATSELRRSDRRGVAPQHLLYMAMNIMRIRIKESLKAFRHVGQDKISKKQVQSDDIFDVCIETNLAFLRSIPNSAHYWAERKRDLFSMIRQYGKPTVLFTISANEIGWPKLIQLLHNLKNSTEISVEEAADLHVIEKSTLVNEDAVTCAIYFNKLVNILLKILQSKRYSPFKKYRVLHYFKRIEFPHKGGPDAHILAWLENAPEDALGKDYNEAIGLIDFLISVSAVEASGNIRLQTHKHSFTCYEGTESRRQQKCRYDAPFMPVKTTMILTPMPDTENNFQQYKTKYNVIRKNLENYEYNDFKSFYQENDIASDEEYVNIIRAGINMPRVFPKREPCEKWHSPFNPFILNVVKANTDLHFITEEYSCAAHVVDYINKANRGISNLQRKIIEIMDKHPEFNLFDITKNISNNLLNQTEMTSQEAAWYLLREPMSKSSTTIVYIPTILPVERQRIKKKMKEIEQEDDSTDIWKENWFDKYEKRPEDLANITLAQFVAKYYKNKNGEYALREEPIVIRYRNYDMTTDFNEYRREMVTLHLPFRSEETEILVESRYLELYEKNEALIIERRKEFESNVDIQKILEICRELYRENVPVGGQEIKDVVGRLD